jgi:putative NIF3 family GTP cyclohydrolase 1 type 2
MESHRIEAFMGEATELSQFIMLDEFQEVMKIRYSDGKQADGVGLYQWAVEGRKCPHIVTGSAIRLITQEVLGTGALFGRFRYIEFPPLEGIYALELVDKLAHKYGVQIEEPVAGHLVTRCGGSPFYIHSVFSQATDQGLSAIPNENAVDDLLAHEISHGLIWRDWAGQLQRYFEQINSHYIAKTVLFHAAQCKDQHIEPEMIAAAVKRPVEEVEQVLRQLSFADMIDASGGYIFRNVKDPILREFIRVQYQLDILHQPADQVIQELQAALAHWKGKYADAVGELIEARLAALLHRFDGRRVAGRLFDVEGEIELPRFDTVYDTVVKAPGDRMRQIDLVGSRWHAARETMWIVEIKHWRQRVDAGVVREFAAACQAFSQSRTLPTERMVKWLVNAGGFTEGALAAMREEGILHSGAAEINELLAGFGLQRLLR